MLQSLDRNKTAFAATSHVPDRAGTSLSEPTPQICTKNIRFLQRVRVARTAERCNS